MNRLPTPHAGHARTVALGARLLGWLLILAAAARAADGGAVRVEIRDPQAKPVADAVAWLMPLEAKPTIAPPAEPVVVAQHHEEFHPLVTAICVGTRVNFPNEDNVAHHVFSQSKAKSFDIPRYRGVPKETILFDRPGVVALGCNIHDWMLGYIVVLETPYFAKSGDDGVVPLKQLPAGHYRLEVWHPRVKETVTRDITLRADDAETQVISVTLRPDKRIRRAPEAGTAGYR